jgi:hypothetical protein
MTNFRLSLEILEVLPEWADREEANSSSGLVK